QAKQPEPGHQAVQRTANQPSRTSIDYNGDLVVANIGMGQQGSVTRIANDISSCIDRNKNGTIDTSKDTNGNGSIDVDCNGDGQPDVIASVKARPCRNGLGQEFFGPDDECVLWTTNVAPGSALRAVSLAAGANDTNRLLIFSDNLWSLIKMA